MYATYPSAQGQFKSSEVALVHAEDLSSSRGPSPTDPEFVGGFGQQSGVIAIACPHYKSSEVGNLGSMFQA